MKLFTRLFSSLEQIFCVASFFFFKHFFFFLVALSRPASLLCPPWNLKHPLGDGGRHGSPLPPRTSFRFSTRFFPLAFSFCPPLATVQKDWSQPTGIGMLLSLRRSHFFFFLFLIFFPLSLFTPLLLHRAGLRNLIFPGNDGDMCLLGFFLLSEVPSPFAYALKPPARQCRMRRP